MILPESTPLLFPATVAFAPPVATAALFGGESPEAHAVRILAAPSAGWVACQLALAPPPEASVLSPTPDYPFDSRLLGCPAAGETPEAVAAEIAAYVTAPVSPAAALAQAKAAKLDAISAGYAGEIAAGVTAGGQTYGVAESDQGQWIAALTALANAQTVTGFDPAQQDATALLGPLLNRAGAPVGAVTVAEFRVLMAELTTAIGQLRAAALTKSAAVAAAADLAALDSIEP